MVLGLNDKDYYDFILLISKKENIRLNKSENKWLMRLIALLWRQKQQGKSLSMITLEATSSLNLVKKCCETFETFSCSLLYSRKQLIHFDV